MPAIPHSTPATIVAANQSLMPTGAKKLVTLANGWIVATTTEYYGQSNAVARFYKSNDGGTTWSPLCRAAFSYNRGAAIVADGTRVYALMGGLTAIRLYYFDATSINNVDIGSDGTKYKTIGHTTYTNVYETSLAIGTDRRLHAAVAFVTDARPNINIMYSEMAAGYGFDNDTRTSSAITNISAAGSSVRYPSIVVRHDGNPSIAMITTSSSQATPNTVSVARYDGSKWIVTGDNVSPLGLGVTIETSLDAPNAVALAVTPDGALHAVWGTERNPKIKHARSLDGGVTWSQPTVISSAVDPSRYPATAVIGGKLRAYWEADINSNMARYDRYTVNKSSYSGYTYYHSPSPSWVTVSGAGAIISKGFAGYQSVNFDSDYGFSGSGTAYATNIGSPYYEVPSQTRAYRYVVSYEYDSKHFYATVQEKTCTRVDVPGGTTYSRGNYVDTVYAQDGTYPPDGRSGDYWYVKQATGLFRVMYRTFDSSNWGDPRLLRDTADDRTPRLLGDGGANVGVMWFDSTANKIMYSAMPAKSKISELGVGALKIPLYDPSVGLDGKNQLRVKLTNAIGCFELVLPTDPTASPLRVMTSNGIRAVAK